jgi:hypothetical protein
VQVLLCCEHTHRGTRILESYDHNLIQCARSNPTVIALMDGRYRLFIEACDGSAEVRLYSLSSKLMMILGYIID